jgi:hypothetical protein
MISPMEASRRGIEADFSSDRSSYGNAAYNRLIALGQTLPTQFDRQVDVVLANAIPAGGGSSSPVYPFDVISAGTSVFSFQAGTINGLLPTNYAATFTLSLNTTYYPKLSLTANNGQITAATLSFPTTAPSAIPTNMGQPPTSFDFLLGLLLTNGSGGGTWYRTIGPGSLSAAGQESFRTTKVSPAPGTLPYDIWFTWTITQA